MQHLSGVWGDVLGWAAVLAGLATFAGLLVLNARRRPAPRSIDAPVAAKLDKGREWELVMRRATQDLSRGVELAALQADTALKIESVEHAYNRLVADCAKLCRIAGAPTLEPASRLSLSEPEKAPENTSENTPCEPERAEERPPLAA